jgi:membrane dipeptidase
VEREHGPWIDLHGHAGACFLAGLDPDDLLPQLLGGERMAQAMGEADTAGMAAVSLSTVADLLVLGPDASGGLRAVRRFEPDEARADHDRQLTGMLAAIDGAGVSIVGTAADVERAHERATVAALLTCEGGDFLGGDLSGLAVAHERGVRSLTLVHYRVNELGDIQTEAPVHGGLTAFGRDVVTEANRLGVILDCAHATLAVTRDVVAASTDPVMISHSHLDHLDRHHPRLLSDEHALLVAEAGGLIGAWPSGVTSATLHDFVDEIIRLVELVGVVHVGIGTDLDANFQPVLTGYRQVATLAEQLGERGLIASDVDRILGGNALDLIRRVCG